MSRSTRRQAQQKAADVKARSDANSREMRAAAATARTRLLEDRAAKAAADLAASEQQVAASTKRLARAEQAERRGRRRGQGSRPICTTCKERKVGPSADAMNIGPPGMCDRCYDEAGRENEHSDYGHPEVVQGCPACGTSTVGKTVDKPDPAPAKQPTGRKRAPKDPNRPTKYQVAEQYGDRILKGRHEFGYTWQGIAEVLHLIPRGDDVPRSVKVWGHVVVWDAYLIVCQQKGIEPRRKVVRGAVKRNGGATVDNEPKHDPNGKPKTESKRQRESRERKEAKLNQPAKSKAQRTRKALALDTLDLPGLRERIEGRTVTYIFNGVKGEATAFVGQIHRIGEIKTGRLAVWFYEQVAVDERTKRVATSNLRTLYLDQIVEVS
jgi:hypothetical protein